MERNKSYIIETDGT